LKVYKYIRDNGGWDNWAMELVQYYPTDDKLKLFKKEGELIRELGATLNSKIAGRTKAEYCQDNKLTLANKKNEYYKNNREDIINRIRNYCENNKPIIALRGKIWRENHKDVMARRRKEYYEKNKVSIDAKKKEKNACECGGCFSTSNKHNHLKTQKHINYIQSLANVKV
jgi:hypothetical protein